ncbi:hypothetical protein VCHA50O413_70094 [Vibrio chagasii]|nr:hypothetical protein VCHA34P114_90152 [Vibrio chagasii]CAH7326642.1 hypothetical protein VCHA50O409_70152 [Vibrio chagasii]CAH7358152.1 hypothetical protein VCHA50O402_60093 [Vibrio chagasii]CAH7370854.1 hypothetical protein VCHA50O405_70094 [Vibrio chagasii]CAH7400150.1 hypothetical protein VCHA50O413_70094 [Vibrio chagasii]
MLLLGYGLAVFKSIVIPGSDEGAWSGICYLFVAKKQKGKPTAFLFSI